MVVNAAKNAIVKTSTEDAVSVGSSSTTVLAANGKRTNAVFTNNSNEKIFLARGGTAVLNKGIMVSSNGGSYEIGIGNMYRGIVTGICASGSKSLCTSEGV